MSLDPQDFKKQAEEGKLDSRLKYKQITHPTLQYERTYCFNCGKEKGWVTQESSKFIKANNIIVICDDCESLFGTIPLQKADIKEINQC